VKLELSLTVPIARAVEHLCGKGVLFWKGVTRLVFRDRILRQCLLVLDT